MFLSSVLVPELIRARRADRDVPVDAQAPLLHVHVGDAELADRGAEELRPLPGLGGGADVGLGDDLDQRRTAAVEVHERGAGAVDPAGLADVGQLGRVLLQVGAMDADVAELAVDRNRLVVLADLVALRQVGIEVVLAGELGALRRPRTRARRRSSARSGSPPRSSSAASPGARGRPGRCGRWARRRRRASSRRTSWSWSRAGRGSPARSRPRSPPLEPPPPRPSPRRRRSNDRSRGARSS